jgi:uncharacterized repeat protein (TIGR02543 family)
MKKILTFFVMLGLLVPFLPFNVKADAILPGEVNITVVYILGDSGPEDAIFMPLAPQPFGSTITPIPSVPPGYTFKYWIVNDFARPELPENYTFYVASSDMFLISVYAPVDEHVVLFTDSNGASLDWAYYSDGEIAVPPTTLPDKPGLVISDPAWKNINTGSSDLTINADSVYQLQYESVSIDTYDLNLDGSLNGSYAYNEIVTLVADASDGIDPFSHWEENGVVVSRDLEYSFTMMSERNLNKVYLETPQSDDAIISSSRDLAIRENYQTYMGQFYIPDGYTIVEYGFLIHNYDNISNLTLNTSGVTIAKSNNYNPATNEFMMSFELWSHINARAYLVYDTGSTLVDIYSEVENTNVLDIVYDTGFEASEGFSASTSYQSTILGEGDEPETWNFYYGTPSTTSPLYDEQSAQMRWYDSTPENLGYIETNFKVSPLSKITFFAEITSSNGVAVSISTDKVTWTDTIVYDYLTTSPIYCTYLVESDEDVYVRFSLILPETPASGSRLYIDNLSVTELVIGPSHLVTFNNEGVETLARFKDNGTISDRLNPTKTGYTFEGWYLEDTFETQFILDSDPVTQDMTLYAKYTINQYTINFDSDGGSTVDPITDDYNVVVDRPVDPTKDGYIFDDWYIEDQLLHLASDYDGFRIDSNDKTLYAKWDLVTYNITYNLDVESTNNPSNPDTYNVETPTFTLADPTKDGFSFDGWFLEDTFVTEITSIEQGSFTDYAIYPKFTETIGTYYTVTFDSNDGTDVDSQSILENDNAVAPTDPTRSGYTFEGWFTDDETFINSFSFSTSITGDITLYAKWDVVITSTELFISEYGEGSSYNKWIEIYNGTGVPVDLSEYTVNLYTNGNSDVNDPNTSVPLSGTLAHGDVYIIYHSSAVQTIIDAGDLASSVVNFNGDDCFALLNSTGIIDIILSVGHTNNLYDADNLTWVRKTTIYNPNSTFTLSEWDEYPSDTFDYIGYHIVGE